MFAGEFMHSISRVSQTRSGRIKGINSQYQGGLLLELQQRSHEFSSIIGRHQNIRSSLLERMPVLDEAVYSGRSGSLPATDFKSNSLPSGVANLLLPYLLIYLI